MNIEEIRKRIIKIQKGDYLPLNGDLQYKFIFGTNDNLKYTTRLLELLFKLEKDSLKDSKIMHEVKLDRKTVNSKSFELDVVVELPNKDLINLEMQKVLDFEAEKKNTLYVSKLFGGIIKRGEDYRNIKKVSQIEFIKENKRHKTNKMINTYHLTNDEDINDKILKEYFEIKTIDIEKSENLSYNEEVDEELLKFIKIINANTLENALEIAKNNLLLMEMIEKMVEFNNNEYVQDYAREQALIDSRFKRLQEDVDVAREEGRIEGHAEGRIEGKNMK